jgi:diguanylate cyclase (GGDEF)-like protein
MFREYLDRAVAHARRNQQNLAVLFLDVDNFKHINDTLGHHAGDVLLQEVADRLTKVLRGDDYVAHEHTENIPDDVLARLGGDEFIILLPDIQDTYAPGAVAQRLIEIIAKPIIISEQECHVSASIVITLYPMDGEITESTIMSDLESAVQMLDEVKALGISVALDDFGTGYSSLSYLRRLPIDTLKIDRSFVREIDEKPADAEIIGAITAMAHTLRLRVVVEVIETECQLRAVVDRQWDAIQGFLFSRPLPADEIATLLARRNLRIARGKMGNTIVERVFPACTACADLLIND